MEMNQIPTADLLDIVFEGRNKSYGAYELRKTYNRRLTKSLSIMAAFCLLLIGGYTLAGKTNKQLSAPPVVTDVSLSKAVDPIPPTPPPPIKIPVQQIATLIFTPPKIVKDAEVKPDEKPPTQDDLVDVKIGDVNQKGIAEGDIVAPPVGDGGKGIVDAPKPRDNPDSVFLRVEIESSYPGGIPAWQRFLLKNFVTPEEALSGEIGGTVMVKFIVDRAGTVSDVVAISGPDELRREAVRVIRKSGKWIPAIQNGQAVASYKQQPIIVKVQNE